jgi:hypothetical protein
MPWPYPAFKKTVIELFFFCHLKWRGRAIMGIRAERGFAAPVQPTVPWLYILAVGLPTGLAALALVQPWLPPKALFADPAEITGANPFTGGISTFSDMVWFAAGVVCLFGATLIRGPRAWFLLSAGALSVLLALDDFYLLHEVVLPRYAGIGERYVKAFYLMAAGTYAVIFYRLLRGLRWQVLVLAGACFTLSMALDTIAIGKLLPVLPDGIMFYVVEDGLKSFGIFLWTAFHLEVTSLLIRAG